VAKTYADQGLLIPSAIQIPTIRRANFHLLGYPDLTVKDAIVLTRPQLKQVELMLKGLLCSRDISLPEIASYLSLPTAVVNTYSDLFFNVNDRLDDTWHMAGIAYPETRIGQVPKNARKCLAIHGEDPEGSIPFSRSNVLRCSPLSRQIFSYFKMVKIGMGLGQH
jgi:hypothetical protein